jgi:hypothetical protein
MTFNYPAENETCLYTQLQHPLTPFSNEQQMTVKQSKDYETRLHSFPSDFSLEPKYFEKKIKIVIS